MATTVAAELTYHMYAGVEDMSAGKVADYLQRIDQFPPNPALSLAFTAEDPEGNIVGISVIQAIPMVEPFHAEPGYGSCLGELFAHTQKWLEQSGTPRVLMHTEHRVMQHMLHGAGAEPWHVTMFQWLRGKT